MDHTSRTTLKLLHPWPSKTQQIGEGESPTAGKLGFPSFEGFRAFCCGNKFLALDLLDLTLSGVVWEIWPVKVAVLCFEGLQHPYSASLGSVLNSFCINNV
jgi:hypothetical protein